MDTSFSADEHFRLGLEALEKREYAEALVHFRAANTLDPTRPSFRSHHGLCVGIVERRFGDALEMCRSAAKEEFFNPTLYHNLARVHFAFGFKTEGIRYLRRGLMIDPGNASILSDFRNLGVRSKPVLGFLRRDHLMNRCLGLMRNKAHLDTGPALELYRI